MSTCPPPRPAQGRSAGDRCEEQTGRVPQVTDAASPAANGAPILRRVRAGAKRTAAPAPKKAAAPRRTAARSGAADASEQLAAISQVIRALADPTVGLDQVADLIVKTTMKLAGAQNGSMRGRLKVV